jgi:hypothetical protein
MATTEATTETRQKIMDEATTEKLDDVSPANSPEPETQGAPQYRAHVVKGNWAVPPSTWKVNDLIYVRNKSGKPVGPFYIVNCHAPTNPADIWRYDITDNISAKTKLVLASVIC